MVTGYTAKSNNLTLQELFYPVMFKIMQLSWTLRILTGF